MKYIKDYKNHNSGEINESKRTDLKLTAEKIYDLVKNRPFSGKQETVRDIVRLLRSLN